MTLVCNEQSVKAHRRILSTCSPYFKTLLELSSANDTIVLDDVPFLHLASILEFMYAGEVNIVQNQLTQFLKTAEKLKVIGLAEIAQPVKRRSRISSKPEECYASLKDWVKILVNKRRSGRKMKFCNRSKNIQPRTATAKPIQNLAQPSKSLPQNRQTFTKTAPSVAQQVWTAPSLPLPSPVTAQKCR